MFQGILAGKGRQGLLKYFLNGRDSVCAHLVEVARVTFSWVWSWPLSYTPIPLAPKNSRGGLLLLSSSLHPVFKMLAIFFMATATIDWLRFTCVDLGKRGGDLCYRFIKTKSNDCLEDSSMWRSINPSVFNKTIYLQSPHVNIYKQCTYSSCVSLKIGSISTSEGRHFGGKLLQFPKWKFSCIPN